MLFVAPVSHFQSILGLDNHQCFPFVVKDFGAFSVFIQSYFFPLFQLLYHLSVPPSFHSAHHSFTFPFSQKPHTLNTSSPPLFPLRTPLSPLPSPFSTLYLQCSMHCKL